jgi:glycosyltransferase involved in cell wall biosynthesis
MNISMLITTFNRGPYLADSLARLRELTSPDQLVVVNDGGDHDCEEIARSYAHSVGVDATILYNDNPGKTVCSQARNLGLSHCTGDVILTTEPEVHFRSDVVAQAPGLMAEHETSVITPGTVFYAPNDWDGDLSNPGPQQQGNWIPPYVGLWRKSWLEGVGGWDEGFPGTWGGEDVDLFARLKKIGIDRWQAWEMDVVHKDHLTANPEENMPEAEKNAAYMYAKPYWHGHIEHRCSTECLRRLGVIA